MAAAQSLALQIELAIVAALGESGAPAPVDRGATGDYSVDVMPMYNVEILDAANSYARGTDNDSLQVTRTWGIFCYACPTQGIKAADAVDPLMVWAHQKLQDQRFGGLARPARFTQDQSFARTTT